MSSVGSSDRWSLASDDENNPLLSNAAIPEPVKLSSSVPSRSKVQVTSGKPAINGGNRLVSTSPLPHEEPVASYTLYFAIFSCAIGTSFSFGYAVGSLNTCAQVMQDEYATWYNASHHHAMSSGESTFLWTATVSIYCLGGLLSGCIGGMIADRFGRKHSMMVMNTLHILAVVLMFSSIWLKRYEVIIAGRFVYGLYGGLATVICPLYLNEISPPSLKGKAGTVHQLSIVIALSIAQVVGLPQILGTSDRFYYILGLTIVPAILHWIMLGMCPESPSWLYLLKKDKDGARNALERLRDMSVMSSVDFELSEYHKAELEAASAPEVSLKDMFTTYRRRSLLIAVIMHCSQQLSGINAVIFYSTSIFVNAHLTHTEAQYATLSLGAVTITFTLVSLILIERLGRRTLHLHGLGGCFISLTLLTASLLLEGLNGMSWVSYFCIVFVALYMVSFACGPGSIPWFYTAEIFDLSSSKWAISIATAVNWACNFSVGLLFPILQAALLDYAFLPFMVLITIFWTFLYYRAPETKGRSSAQLSEYFKTVHSVASLPAQERRHYQTFT